MYQFLLVARGIVEKGLENSDIRLKHNSRTAARQTISNTNVDRTVLLMDRFCDEIARGRVIGSAGRDGIIRKGIDSEGIIGIDNGALRIQPLTNPGWGRAGIAYGPYTRRSGLAFATFLMNGHNISRTTPLPDGFKMRLWRWAIGSATEKPLTRIIRWIGSGDKRLMWRRLMQWIRSGTRFFQLPQLDENLAVGWFPTEAPADPLQQGNALIVHAIVPEGGELWARIGSSFLRTVRGLQNVPIYYVIVLREKGAAYYAASIPGVVGLLAHPVMQLLAIDSFNTDETVYAGVHQSVLGETGFRADTRIYSTQVAELPGFGAWYGSAHAADVLTGDGPLHLSDAETGGGWKVYEGEFRRTARGAEAVGASNTAVLDPKSSSGLVHLLIEATDAPVDTIALVWRAQDQDNFWSFEVGSEGCRLSLKENGSWSQFPAVEDCRMVPNTVNSLQVVDNGKSFRLYLNSSLVYRTLFSDTRLSGGRGVGIRVDGEQRGAWLRSFESHPREIPIPSALALNAPWVVGRTRVVVRDDFEGTPADLARHATTVGRRQWRRDIGQGEIHLTGRSSVKVLGSVERPCPGRTAYTIEWSNPRFADLEVTITPPGTRPMMRETGRAGLIFWQDAGNYLILSAFIGDYPAMSIAAFFKIDGFEELYDAVWSNVGNRMQLGRPHDFQVVFDGNHFQAFINSEPVLYRALRDVYPNCSQFLIHRVGIVANWEWGNDTGSVFQNFVARERA
jgi:hypothetical protein